MDLQTAMFHMFLAIASAWAYMQCQSLKFASLAFVLYTLVGFTGLLEYLVNSHDFSRLHNAVFRLCRPFYYPLVAVQALHLAGFDHRLSLLLLVCPVVFVVSTELLDKRVSKDMLDLNTIACTVALCYDAYKLHNVFAAITALLDLFAFFGVGDKSRNGLDHVVLVALGDIAAVQFFNNYFKL